MKIRLVVIGFFLAILSLGTLIYDDYGISLDEPAQRLIGITNLNYVAETFGYQSILQNPHFSSFSTQTLMKLEDRHYGVIYELPAAAIEIFINPADLRTIYLARHFLTFIYFLCGLVALYGLTKLRYRSSRISLLACTMLLLSPRIFADAFYNDKDIVFLSVFLLATLTMAWYLINPTWTKCLLHAAASAIAIDTRLIAFAIPLMTITIFGVRFLGTNWSKKRIMAISIFYLIASAFFIVLLWPYLWTDPLANIFEAFEFISRHPHSAALIFQGKEVLTSELPWYYLPLWIAISTPLLYLFFFCIGSIQCIKSILRDKLKLFENQDQLLDFLFLSLFFGPIFAIATTHTSIYNGWRHLYFVYPFFLLLAIRGLLYIWRQLSLYKYTHKIIIFITTANFIHVGYWMYQNHPLQNVYFNILAGENWNTSYEVDYWGLANRIALQKILNIDNDKLIAIWPGANVKFKSGEPTVFTDQLMLENSQTNSKISSPQNIEEGKYVIASNNAHYSANYLLQHGMFQKFDAVTVDGRNLLTIFSLRKYDALPLPEINKSISFAKNGIGIFYLYGNNPPVNLEQWNSNEWQIPEIWGTWSKGTASSLLVPLPSQDVSKLAINMRAFVSPKSPSQSIQLWINSNLLQTIKIDSNLSKEFIIDLPKSINTMKTIKIEFKGLNPHSPNQTGINQDNRQIAIGLESLKFQ